MKRDEMPVWFGDIRREAEIRAGMILYGNTRDRYWTGKATNYGTLPFLLLEGLDTFSIRARWDRVDGLVFFEQAHQTKWQNILERRLSPNPVENTNSYDVGEEDIVAMRGTQVALDELLAQYRQVLQEERERPLLVVDWTHLLVTQPAHPDPMERQWLLQLGKALVGEPLQKMNSDHFRRGKGLVIFMSAHLGSIPPVLYQGESRIRLFSVPSPSRQERREFFERHADDLMCVKPVLEVGRGGDGRRLIVEHFADATEQLNFADLLQIIALSRSLGETLPAERLLSLYLFGEQRSPWEELSEEKLMRVEDLLKKRVVGQEEAVRRVATMILRAWLGLAGLQHSAKRSKPKGTLFFVGPTGVGKTELAKACAEFLFGDEVACVRFDMSEYNHEHSDQRLIGAPPGYVGFEEGGQLTNAVRKRPFCVLLFDEIEKAHGRILDKFLQVLEDGRLTDGRGETAWFGESVIIFTSNLGAADAPPLEKGKERIYAEHFLRAVEEHFTKNLGRPELLNRLGENIVVFFPIEEGDLRRRILEKKLEPLKKHLKERWGVGLQIQEDVLSVLLEQARKEHGGRGLLNAIERTLLNDLTWFLFERHAKLRQGRVVKMTAKSGKIEIELSDE